MPASDLERLVVSLSADIKSYEREMKRASNLTTDQVKRIATQAHGAGAAAERVFARGWHGVGAFGSSTARTTAQIIPFRSGV